MESEECMVHTTANAAGHFEAEAEGFVLTNTVSKTSMSSGLSPQGRRQVVNDSVPKLEELGACTDVQPPPLLGMPKTSVDFPFGHRLLHIDLQLGTDGLCQGNEVQPCSKGKLCKRCPWLDVRKAFQMRTTTVY